MFYATGTPVLAQNETVSTWSSLKDELREELLAKNETPQFIYSGDVQNLQDEINTFVNDLLLESEIQGTVSSWGLNVSGYVGAANIDFTISYNSVQLDSVATYNEVQNFLRTRLINKEESVSVIFTGDATNLETEIGNVFGSVLNEEGIVGTVTSVNWGYSGSSGNTILEFTFTYQSTSTTDDESPTAPTQLSSNEITSNSVTLSWTASTDNIGVVGYDVYNGTELIDSVTDITSIITGLNSNTTYSLTVKAKDSAGNLSVASDVLSITTLEGQSGTDDTEVPTAPTNLIADNVTSSSITMSWTAGTDNIGIIGYDIYINGNLAGTFDATTLTINGLAEDTTYTFSVYAKDAAGNLSESSNELTSTTSSTTIEPTGPMNLSFTNISDSSVTISWDASELSTPSTSYKIYNYSEHVGTTSSTTFTVTDLQPNSYSNFMIVLVDESESILDYSKEYMIKTTTSSEEQLNEILMEKYESKNDSFELTYSGDNTNLQNNIGNLVVDAYQSSTSHYFIDDMSYSMSGSEGNLLLDFSLTYEDVYYPDVTYTLEEFENVLHQNMIKRNGTIKIIHKGDITTDQIQSISDNLLEEDAYLRLCVTGNTINHKTYMGFHAITFKIGYETTYEQEEYVDKHVAFIVESLISQNMSDGQKEKILHDYVLSRVIYSDNSALGNAYGALYHGETTCEGYAALTDKLFKEAGLESKIVTNTDHAWNLVKIDNKWYHVDTTWNDGKKRDDGYYKYYNMSDAELLDTRSYTNSSGIICENNYISELNLIDNEINYILLQDLVKNMEYESTNTFKTNSSMNLMYNEIVLKEGEQLSLLDSNIAPDFYTGKYHWSSSNEEIAEVLNGTITAKKAGKIFIAAEMMYPSIINTNLLAVVTVVPDVSNDGETPQVLTNSNIQGINNTQVTPKVTINSNENINTTTTVTNCIDELEGKIKLIGEPIDIQTTSNFNWADITFKLSSEKLNELDINDLVIYWYDDINGTIVPQATKVDPITGEITATVTHFSKYFLSDKSIQEGTLNIAFVVDSHYGTQDSIDKFKLNISNTLIELRKEKNLLVVFSDDNSLNVNDIQNLYFSRIEYPSISDDYEIIQGVNGVFNNITPLNNTPVDQTETQEICTNALTKGRDVLRSKDHVFNIFGIDSKNYALIYTKWYGYFVDNNSILLDMHDSVGLIIGKTIAYYENGPIAFDIPNISPLVSFLLAGDYSLVTLNPSDELSWELKIDGSNNSDDVTVLQKTLIKEGYLDMPIDSNGNRLAFGDFESDTQGAVMAYKNHHGFIPNGVVNKDVWTKLMLPWDYSNDEPDRSSVLYQSILSNNNYYLDNTSVTITSPFNGVEYFVGERVTISADGNGCDHIALFVNDQYIDVQSGNNYSSVYTIPEEGVYDFVVKGRNVPGSNGGELVSSNLVSVLCNGYREVELPADWDSWNDVKKTQYYLNELGFYLGSGSTKVNGIKGPKTNQAVKTFKEMNSELGLGGSFNADISANVLTTLENVYNNGWTIYDNVLDINPSLLNSNGYVFPVYGGRLSDIIRYRRPQDGDWITKFYWHKGIDVAVGNNTPIYATHDGFIVYQANAGVRGNVVSLFYEDNSEWVRHRYQHCQEFNGLDIFNEWEKDRYTKKIKEIEFDVIEVKQGDFIGRTSDSGSGGYHLHFEAVKGDIVSGNIQSYVLPFKYFMYDESNLKSLIALNVKRGTLDIQSIEFYKQKGLLDINVDYDYKKY